MVTSPHHLASQAGLSVLQDGGTALEAAVATAAALASVYPHMTGIGGDGFWLVLWPDGRSEVIDACGRAAGAATVALYRDAGHGTVPWRGPLAANTVAGTLSGWDAALRLSESVRPALPLARLLRDAIHHARAGSVVTAGHARLARDKASELAHVPGYAALFMPDGHPLREGDVFRNPMLARTLERLARDGLADFYDGAVLADVVADLAAVGSPLVEGDFTTHGARVVPALELAISGARLFNAPPPTQGLASLLILGIADRLAKGQGEDFTHIHALVEATKQAFAVRDADVGDPAFMQTPAQAILNDPAVIDGMAANIDMARAAPWPQRDHPGDTVWLGAIDSDGLAVSMIQSTYFEFGSGVVLPRTGIVWQNRGASFRLVDEGWNALRPGRQPFHTLNPAGARLKDGRVMVYGTMGGEGQPQTQAALFSRYVWHGMGLQDAVTAPRWLLGRTWGQDSISLKYEDRFAPDVITQLQAAGHAMERVAPFTSLMGHAGAVVRHASGVLEGATDPRSDGSVAAW
ncbi:gamma-glutamyltransferase family protein [Ameyamaea chiangmaiensis]|nr:gamma-glutamyltransferase family protein [Ameyamaea chiangmaiensis]MBS4074077.1 gamma-glutamyltransferase family protein [Ameyamaea chiangmaiensis]